MKKLLLKFSVLSVVLSALYSCNPILPEFTFSPESPKAGQKVTFTNATVEEAESWNWTFGDGGFSVVKNTSYIYKKP
jgi:PKD repeat protein